MTDPLKLAEEIENGTDSRPPKLGRTAYWVAPDERILLAAALRLAEEFISPLEEDGSDMVRLIAARNAYRAAREGA